MIDKSLMVTVLNTLKSLRDVPGGTEENRLFTEINLEAVQPVAPSLIREHLQSAEDKGWVEKTLGMLRDARWRITPSGSGALFDLVHGG